MPITLVHAPHQRSNCEPTHCQKQRARPTTQRYRLQLRPADQEFFRTNILEHFLPWRYHLAAAVDTPGNSATAAAAPLAGGRAARGTDTPAADSRAAVAGTAAAAAVSEAAVDEAAVTATGDDDSSYPLANETWWRLYQVACFMQGELQAAMDVGLPLQVMKGWCGVGEGG